MPTFPTQKCSQDPYVNELLLTDYVDNPTIRTMLKSLLERPHLKRNILTNTQRQE